MKNNPLTLLVTMLLAGALGPVAHADTINGSIGFAGSFSTDNNSDFAAATKFTSMTAYVLSSSGDYGSVPIFTPVTFTPFSFTQGSVAPLWSIASGAFAFNGIIDTFQATQSTILASGYGVATILGFSSTPGFWNLAGSGSGLSLTFAAETTVSSSVPDGASTIVLLGLMLLCISAHQIVRQPVIT